MIELGRQHLGYGLKKPRPIMRHQKPYSTIERAAYELYSRNRDDLYMVRIVERGETVKFMRMSRQEEQSAHLFYTLAREEFGGIGIAPFLRAIWQNKNPVYFIVAQVQDANASGRVSDIVKAAFESRLRVHRCYQSVAMTVKNPDILMSLMLMTTQHVMSGFEAVWCYDPTSITATKLSIDEFIVCNI